jgi:hypothetical protein
MRPWLWIILATVGLGPVLTYWSAGILGRSLRRTLRWRMSRDASVVADRSESTPQDRPPNWP